jgi:GNAT superfamily N-acetyltransferase
MNCTIRTIAINDLPELALLFDAYRVFYGKKSDVQAALEFLNDRFHHQESMVYVAEHNDRTELLGFVQLYPLFSSTRMRRLWLLNDLFVVPAYRGQGVSKLLIEQAKQLALASDACGLMLETAKDNHIGNALYPAMGFELETHANFYTWDTPNT